MGDLLLVGCGKMGGAMLEGWLARGLSAADVIVAITVIGDTESSWADDRGEIITVGSTP